MSDIYLDNNATTMVDPKVVEAMLPYFSEQFGNPSSLHSFGNKVGMALKKARKQVQTLLGAEHDSEIIFTSCGTESDSTAILSALKALPDRKEIITTVVEHPACSRRLASSLPSRWGIVTITGGGILSTSCYSPTLIWESSPPSTRVPGSDVLKPIGEPGVAPRWVAGQSASIDFPFKGSQQCFQPRRFRPRQRIAVGRRWSRSCAVR